MRTMRISFTKLLEFSPTETIHSCSHRVNRNAIDRCLLECMGYL